MATKKATFLTVVRATGDEPIITISTNTQDRDGDVLDPAGCVLTNYKKNPVVLFGHNYSALPVGSSTSIDVVADGVRASWRWLEGDEFADRVKNAFSQGVLRAASVGFKPLASEPLGSGRGIHYTSWELLEWSLVPVPSNPSAVRTLKGLGLLTPSIEKGGRVLSSMNEQHVREALDHAVGCGEHLRQVLACLRDESGDDIIDLDIAPDDEETATGDDLQDIDEKTLEAAFGDIRRDLRRHIEREVRQSVTHEVAALDLDGVGSADVARAVRAELRSAIRNVLEGQISRAINQARGRLD